MEGRYQVSLRCHTMLFWTLVVILLMLPHYSESACNVSNCNQLQCNGYTCHGCKYGYYLQYGSACIRCQQSLPNCVTCSSSTSCTECNDGYYLQSGSCVQCLDRCSTCSSSTQCTTCKDTYWNENNNGCSSYCSDNCLDRRCNYTTGVCYSCIADKYGPQCGQDCNLCKDGQCGLRKCTNGCKDGYYQENYDSGYSYCWKCAYNCITCSNGTYCTQCEQGYYRNYYRLDQGDRGRMNCLQCSESCMACLSTEHCHEDCIPHCSEPVTLGTTKSTYESATIQSTTSKLLTSKNEPPTQTQKMSKFIKSTESTPTEDLYKELNSSQQQMKSCYENENQLTFGHGFAAGFGVAIVLFGSGVGIALFIQRQTKQHKKADENLEGHHEYVNTNMTDILSVMSSENNEVPNDIHTVSSDLTNTGVTNIDSSRDYVMLGDRPIHESDYTDLQST